MEMEMEMEMEMRANEEIRQGEDMTPPLSPLTFALHDSIMDPNSSSFCSLELLAALNLLHSPSASACPPPSRLFGLLTNRDKLLSSSDPIIVSKIREGARELAKAIGNLSNDVAWEEAALCLVMTNAVEVQDTKTGRVLGIAVYDQNFSSINHNCSPNACYRFLLSDTNTASFLAEPKIRIANV